MKNFNWILGKVSLGIFFPSKDPLIVICLRVQVYKMVTFHRRGSKLQQKECTKS